eukprot:908058-Pyramimonas_sp.AAC.2
MSKVVLSEQQHGILDSDRVATMRVYATAAAKRAAVVMGDDLLTMPDVQANPVKVSKALYTELKTWFSNKRANIHFSGVKHHDFEMRMHMEIRQERKGRHG